MTARESRSASGGQGAPRSHHRRGPRSENGRSACDASSVDGRGGQPQRMLRLLHTADVHLGARHADLGEQAAAQRERQFAAFKAAVDLAIAREGRRRPDRRRPVRLQHPAAPIGRARRGRAQAPGRGEDPDGDHPGHPRRLRPGVASTGSTTSRPWPAAARTTTWSRSSRRTARASTSRRCDVVVHGPVFATKRAPHSPLRDLAVAARRARPRPGRSAWSTAPSRSPAGRIATRSSSPGGDRGDAGSTTSPSATGTRPSRARPARPPTPTPARPSRSRSPGRRRQGPARRARRARRRRGTVTVEERPVGRTRFEKLDVDAATIAEPAGAGRAARGAGRSGPRPRRPADGRPARRARRASSTRSRTRSSAVLPQGPRPRRVACRR